MTVQELKAIFLHVVKDNYCNFEGRASRYEYWWFVVINLVLSCVCTVLDQLVGLAIFSGILCLALLLPGLGLCVRRLHDINKSGWWLFLGLIPFVGAIIILVWAAQKGDEAANDFGEVPIDNFAPKAE
jgi:uncharacterized membrane protein YhaH (DUF805 family)